MKNKYTEKEQGLFNKLSKTGKLLYGKLRGMSENLEDVFPSVDGLAKEFECTPRAIAKNLSKMKEMGLIRISHKKSQKSGNICNHYEFPLIYGETLPVPPKEEKKKEIINKIDKNMENKPRKKFEDLTKKELVILFTKMKEALNSGSTTLKENLSNALDRYIKELNTPKQEDCQDQIEDFPSDIEDFPSANENTENTPQPAPVPTQERKSVKEDSKVTRKSVIPEKVDGWLEVVGLVDDKETFKRKCINNGLLMFRNNGQTKDTAQYLYDRLITDAWATMEEVEEKAPDVYSFWKKNQDTFNLGQEN